MMDSLSNEKLKEDIKNLWDNEHIKRLEEQAKIIRKHVVNMIYQAGSGHVGGSLSCVEILAVLYFHFMRHDPLNSKWEDRDRFILSKGHSAPTLYATLAEAGYLPVEELKTLRKFGSRLQGHPDINFNLPGIEVSTGSLGQGLSIGCGIALNARLEKKDFKTYVLLGDGECNEGQIWEAVMFASHYKLDNLIAIIDRNNFQIDGPTEKIIKLEPFAEKWKSFGWNVIEIDGHDIKQIIKAFDDSKKIKDKSTVIIANTIKGKCVSFMEKNNEFHGKSPTREEYELAIIELE